MDKLQNDTKSKAGLPLLKDIIDDDWDKLKDLPSKLAIEARAHAKQAKGLTNGQKVGAIAILLFAIIITLLVMYASKEFFMVMGIGFCVILVAIIFTSD